MKTHIKRISTFLIYTLSFNVISYIFSYPLDTYGHYFEKMIFLVVGITQICFTILFFNKIPLYKTSNNREIKKDLLLYFLILCVLSIAAALFRIILGNSFICIFFNTYFTFTVSASFFNTSILYIGICIIENAIKTYLLYTNISKKTLSKPICIALSVIMILAITVMIFLSLFTTL